MPAYGPEPETTPGRRQGALAVTCLLLALTTSYLPGPAQHRIAWSMRVTVLRPFIATQARLVAAWDNRVQVAVLRQQLDSLAASLSTQAALRDENRTLRNLLDLAERVEPSFKATSVLRGGTPGSESMFIVQLGSRDGITMGAPVVSRHGLVGRILEVREEISLGMDWTHPDFRASAMLENGRYHLRLRWSLRVLDDQGQAVWTRESQDLVLASRRPTQDNFITIPFTAPRSLGRGSYNLELTVIDRSGSEERSTTASIGFELR